MPVHSKLLSAVALVALVVSGNAKDTNLRSNQARDFLTPTTTPVTFSVNIGSTEVDFACCAPLEKKPGSDTLFRRSYQKGERFQGKNDDGRICFGCGHSKTITVTPLSANLKLPYGTTITCPPVVNKANWLSGETHGDTFGITVAGNKITAQRTDKSGSWGIDLKFKCTASPTTSAEWLANRPKEIKKINPALAKCQKMPDGHKLIMTNKKASYGMMKNKKNCFRNLADLAGQRKSAAYEACRKIKPNGKSYEKMKNKKDCFRDIALKYHYVLRFSPHGVGW